MAWSATLRLDYRRDSAEPRGTAAAAARTVAHAQHDGPLRVLKALYPEGEAICHHVVLHPPSGLVAGDSLALALNLGPGSHALLTTPGATRCYRSTGETARQSVRASLAEGARLEWLPQENIVYSGALMVNDQRFELSPGAEMMGWDMLSLGLPASDAPFVAGQVRQRIEVAGLWLDQAQIAANDTLLLNSPLGLAGRRALATLWLVWGHTPADAVAQAALDLARDLLQNLPEGVAAGATRVHPRLLVLRVLGHRIEPLAGLLRAVRAAWRGALWQLPATEPRVWGT